jgi:hypothetical protein
MKDAKNASDACLTSWSKMKSGEEVPQVGLRLLGVVLQMGKF